MLVCQWLTRSTWLVRGKKTGEHSIKFYPPTFWLNRSRQRWTKTPSVNEPAARPPPNFTSAVHYPEIANRLMPRHHTDDYYNIPTKSRWNSHWQGGYPMTGEREGERVRDKQIKTRHARRALEGDDRQQPTRTVHLPRHHLQCPSSCSMPPPPVPPRVPSQRLVST